MHRILGFLPIFISLFWVVLIVGTQTYCRPPHTDEGAVAHIFQLLMAAQVPMIAAFVFTRGVRSLAQVLPTVALQVFAWGAAAMVASRLT